MDTHNLDIGTGACDGNSESRESVKILWHLVFGPNEWRRKKLASTGLTGAHDLLKEYAYVFDML